jgi:hypothetical protein
VGLTVRPPELLRNLPFYVLGNYVVRDANGQAPAYVYSRDNEAEARQAKVLTTDEARRPLQWRKDSPRRAGDQFNLNTDLSRDLTASSVARVEVAE